MSFALSRGKFYIDCNSTINNSDISNSRINMGGGVITNHGTPTVGTDVVNQQYVIDYVTAAIPRIADITLTSTTYTLIDSVLSGHFKITVKNLVVNGPSAHFILSKSFAADNPSITRTNSSAGAVTNERLLVKWEPNSGVFLAKTGVNYNGVYRCRLEYL